MYMKNIPIARRTRLSLWLAFLLILFIPGIPGNLTGQSTVNSSISGDTTCEFIVTWPDH